MQLARLKGRAPLTLLACATKYGSGRDAVLLLVTDPDRPIPMAEDVLRELYRLTAAEIEIAHGLLTGYSLKEIAHLRKVSLGTVRGQLKSIFGKTGNTTQKDLTTFLLQLPRLPKPQENMVDLQAR